MAPSPESESAFTFLPQGAIIQEFRIAGHNIVQSFPKAEYFRDPNISSAFFGETIGRVANRIKDAKIQKLNDQSYTLAANNGKNSLHGGAEGWGKKIWDGPHMVNRNGKEGMLFKYLSKDGEEGYPGTVEARVWYTAGKEKNGNVEKTVLQAEYEVELVGDECSETVINMTNHSYFNLTSKPTIEGTRVTLSSHQHIPVDEAGIPLEGGIKPYPGVIANQEFVLGAEEPDIDHCFIMNDSPSSIPIDTRKLPIKLLAAFYHPESKLHLEVHSTEPAFQYYTGRFIDIPAVEGAPARGKRAGFCVEPSRYIDAVNKEEWRGMSVLKKGQVYGSKTVYKSWKDSE
ncbi:MAG: hypothetical protein M1834_008860 [Cirrosporium novae-zelandiae]|nr:MAG: hypothetical protein M1834_008860 [Cirrosporium novae-zelandiae]